MLKELSNVYVGSSVTLAVRTGWKACPTKTFNRIFQFQNKFLEVL
ncbi:MAG: hypothetical protein V3U37_03460 [Nitrospinaceae bacterium]